MTIHTPLSLIAELTHRCPLRCLYCSNPIDLAHKDTELSEPEWINLIHEAAELGVTQVSFTGGEPCLRGDLTSLVRAAAAKGLYVNLITSGANLTEAMLQSLVQAGVDHVQLSFQDSDTVGAKKTCGVDVLTKKKQVAAWIKAQPVALTINLVIHRFNHSHLEEMIDMAVDLGATKLELAHVQFHGWALKNRAFLLPTQTQVQDSMAIIRRTQERLKGRVRIDYVLPDYYARTPKPCMGGWASKMLLINPQGLAAPCHSANEIPGLPRPSVKNQSLREIWFESPLFNAFRGDAWMKEPCSSCDRRNQDFGGCRCQALALTGDAEAADPVCHKSTDRPTIDRILEQEVLIENTELRYRSLT